MPALPALLAGERAARGTGSVEFAADADMLEELGEEMSADADTPLRPQDVADEALRASELALDLVGGDAASGEDWAEGRALALADAFALARGSSALG